MRIIDAHVHLGNTRQTEFFDLDDLKTDLDDAEATALCVAWGAAAGEYLDRLHRQAEQLRWDDALGDPWANGSSPLMNLQRGWGKLLVAIEKRTFHRTASANGPTRPSWTAGWPSPAYLPRAVLPPSPVRVQCHRAAAGHPASIQSRISAARHRTHLPMWIEEGILPEHCHLWIVARSTWSSFANSPTRSKARSSIRSSVIVSPTENQFHALRPSLTPVYERYRAACHEVHEEPFSYVHFYSNLSYLQSLGLVLLVSTKVGKTYTNRIQPLFDKGLFEMIWQARFG